MRQRQDGPGDVVDGVVAGEPVGLGQGLAVTRQARVDLLQAGDGGAQILGEAGSGARDSQGDEQLGCGAPLEVRIFGPVDLRLHLVRRRRTGLMSAHRG